MTIVFQAVGRTTKMLAALDVGDDILDFVGPLGRPTELEGVHKAIVIGGGVGCAIAYPQARFLHEQGATVKGPRCRPVKARPLWLPCPPI